MKTININSIPYGMEAQKFLRIIKDVMEVKKINVNYSKIAKHLDIDRRTVKKYLNGYVKKIKRNRKSKIDDYYDEIKELLSDSFKAFYSISALYYYLKDTKKLDITYSAFSKYINKHKELFELINKTTNKSNRPVIRFETPEGEQAQLDYKESIPFVLKDTGEIVDVNVFVLLLSYSRYRCYLLTLERSRESLKHQLTLAFEEFGCVPKTILIDNMKSIMDIPRTESNPGKINDEMLEFAKDFNFKFIPCKAGTPRTKGKVESQMRILNLIRGYSGELTLVELEKKIKKLQNDINNRINQGTGSIPLNDFEKEKSSMLSLPNENIRTSYKYKTFSLKVDLSSMISFKSNKYSVPIKYINQYVDVYVRKNILYIYDNTNLIACHNITNKKLNIDKGHYHEIVSQTYTNKTKIDGMVENNLNIIRERDQSVEEISKINLENLRGKNDE